MIFAILAGACLVGVGYVARGMQEITEDWRHFQKGYDAGRTDTLNESEELRDKQEVSLNCFEERE